MELNLPAASTAKIVDDKSSCDRQIFDICMQEGESREIDIQIKSDIKYIFAVVGVASPPRQTVEYLLFTRLSAPNSSHLLSTKL